MIIQFFILIIIVNFFILFRKQGFKKVYPKVSLFFIAFALVVLLPMIMGYISFGGGGLEGQILRERAEKMEALEGHYLEHFIGNTLSDFFAYKWFDDYNPKEVRHGIKTWDKKGEFVAQNKDITELNQIFLQEAKDFISKHPIMYLKQSSIDFLKFNTPMIPNVRMQHVFIGTHPEIPDLAKGCIILFIRFVYLILFILIIYAIIRNIRNWSRMSWLILIVLYFNLIYSLIHAIARYSIPVYPFYIILAAIGLLSIWNKFKNKNENRYFFYNIRH